MGLSVVINLNLMENCQEWQHPFVDIFKKYNTFECPKSYKGSVTVVHVLAALFRTLPSPENVSKLQDQYSVITQLQFLTQLAKSR